MPTSSLCLRIKAVIYKNKLLNFCTSQASNLTFPDKHSGLLNFQDDIILILYVL